MKAGSVILLSVGGIILAGAIVYLTSSKVKLFVDGFVDDVFQGKKSDVTNASGFDEDISLNHALRQPWYDEMQSH